jgi:hypothetical protein
LLVVISRFLAVSLRLNAKSGIVPDLGADDWVRIRDQSLELAIKDPAIKYWS